MVIYFPYYSMLTSVFSLCILIAPFVLHCCKLHVPFDLLIYCRSIFGSVHSNKFTVCYVENPGDLILK
jgi:hypothetical protein